MEKTLKVIAYLLARAIAGAHDIDTMEVLQDADAYADGINTSTGEVREDTTEDDVERLYKLYPTKCPVRLTPTGKCAKNKAQLRTLLKKHTASEIEGIIKRYIQECINGQIYIKNFATFLNQLPDYGEEETIFTPTPSVPVRPRPQG